MEKQYLTWADTEELARSLATQIAKSEVSRYGATLYGIPRGGVYAALQVKSILEKQRLGISLTTNPDEATIFIDDIIDTGRTRDRYHDKYPGIPFLALIPDHRKEENPPWIVFPWEQMVHESGPTDAITRILEYIGEDPSREGLIETPSRVLKSYDQLFGGYKQDPASIMKTFSDGVCDEMVILRGVEFFSTCEHHMMPFTGSASVAYIPNGKIIGVSKLARLVEIFSRRLQVQERLTEQVTATLDEHLKPKGSACVIEAKHFCMCCRGVGKQNASMVTSSLTGSFRKPEVRAEFFHLIKD